MSCVYAGDHVQWAVKISILKHTHTSHTHTQSKKEVKVAVAVGPQIEFDGHTALSAMTMLLGLLGTVSSTSLRKEWGSQVTAGMATL